MPQAIVQQNTHQGDAVYAAVAPRLCTVPAATEHALSALLLADVATNDQRAPTADSASVSLTPFDALKPPAISVPAYVSRIVKYAFSSNACFLAAYLYIKRAAAKRPALAPKPVSVHRLLITALVLAAKYFDDVTYSMGYYAKVGGLSPKELGYLELEMLSALDFRLHIAPYDFHTLEMDITESIRYIPRSSWRTAAIESVDQARIRGEKERYCETLHESDPVGLWRDHPDPSKVVLTSLEATASPCHSSTSSHRREG